MILVNAFAEMVAHARTYYSSLNGQPITEEQIPNIEPTNNAQSISIAQHSLKDYGFLQVYERKFRPPNTR